MGRGRGGRKRGPSLEEIVARLENALTELAAQVADLRWRVERMDRLARPLPGAGGEPVDQPEVRVGGRPVRVRALSPADWIRATGEFPNLVGALLQSRLEGEPVNEEMLGRVVATARTWIAASMAPGQEVDLDLLTVPEAQQAILTIAQLNGLDEALAQFFRARGGGDPGGLGRAEVRDTA